MIVLWGAVLLIAGATIPAGVQLGLTPASVLGVPLAIALCAVILWVLYGTDYRFGEREILIRSGPFRFRVPYDEIESIRPTNNPLSSPACSLDRLEITYRDGTRKIRISPEAKTEFQAELKNHCPRL